MAEKSVKEQIAEAVAESEKGLLKKNKELLQELKDAKKVMDGFKDVDVEKLLKDSKALETLQKSKDKEKGEYKKLYEEAQLQHKADLKKEQDALAEARDSLSLERRSNELTKAMVEHHIEGKLVDSAVTLLLDKVAVNDEGVSMVGDKPVADFVKEWAVGDVGKFFVTPANQGGGATGPGGTGSPEAAYYDPNASTFNRSEQARIANTNPSLHESLIKSAPAKK